MLGRKSYMGLGYPAWPQTGYGSLVWLTTGVACFATNDMLSEDERSCSELWHVEC